MTIGHKCDGVNSFLSLFGTSKNTKAPALAGAFVFPYPLLSRPALFLQRAGIRSVPGRLPVEITDQLLGRWRHRDCALKNNFLRAQFLSVDPFVSIAIRANRRTLE